MACELGAIASGAKRSFGDFLDMLWYGVTATQLDIEAAQRLMDEELAVRPDWMPAELAQAAMEAKP